MQGLQVFDASGRLIFDASTSLTVVLGEVIIAPKTTVTVTNDGLLNGNPFIVATDMAAAGNWIDYSVSGNTLTLTYQVPSWNNSNFNNKKVIYGVY